MRQPENLGLAEALREFQALLTSVALTMLVGAESAYAKAHRGTLDATNGQQDRGTAIDTQATGEEGISGRASR